MREPISESRLYSSNEIPSSSATRGATAVAGISSARRLLDPDAAGEEHAAHGVVTGEEAVLSVVAGGGDGIAGEPVGGREPGGEKDHQVAARRVIEPDGGEFVPVEDLLDHRPTVHLEVGEDLGRPQEHLTGFGATHNPAHVPSLEIEVDVGCGPARHRDHGRRRRNPGPAPAPRFHRHQPRFGEGDVGPHLIVDRQMAVVRDRHQHI